MNGEVRAVAWRDGVVRILDQTRLPGEEVYLEARTPDEVADAIRRLAVRGAPLLGIAAGFGMALAAATSRPGGTKKAPLAELERAAAVLEASRPTAVNLSWAVGRVLDAARATASGWGAVDRRGDDGEIARAVLEEAERIAREDEAACLAIGRQGADLLPDRVNVLTHCNTGALATGGWGTAQGVIVAAHRAGKRVHVWVDETRPVLQGARLTAWELQRLGIPMTLVPDSAAGSLMAAGRVEVVVVGADRIAANGDVANKLGTYSLAVLARHHGVPFYIAAPMSTVDFATANGRHIVIEERDPGEVLAPGGVWVAPEGTAVANAAFDVTPAELITAIITDQGVASAPYASSLASLRDGRAPALASGMGDRL